MCTQSTVEMMRFPGVFWCGFQGFPYHSSHCSGGLFPQCSGVSPETKFLGGKSRDSLSLGPFRIPEVPAQICVQFLAPTLSHVLAISLTTSNKEARPSFLGIWIFPSLSLVIAAFRGPEGLWVHCSQILLSLRKMDKRRLDS